MKRVKHMVFGIAVAWVYACFGSEFIPPTQSAQYINQVASTTRPWYEADDSLVSLNTCLLYTSDAADDLLCVDLGGRRIIKKKKQPQQNSKIHSRRYKQHLHN